MNPSPTMRPRPTRVRLALLVALGLVAFTLVVGRLAIAFAGAEELAGSSTTFWLDTAMVAAVVLPSLYFALQAAQNRPWLKLVEQARVAGRSLVVATPIETDQFDFLRKHEPRIDLGYLPFNAAVTIDRDSLTIWRYARSSVERLIELRDTPVTANVVTVPSALGDFPALELVLQTGKLRLYPFEIDRWWRPRRLKTEELERLSSTL